MAFKKARPNYSWLLKDRVIRRSECGSTKCSILREPFTWLALRVRPYCLPSSSSPRHAGGDSFRRLITAWPLHLGSPPVSATKKHSYGGLCASNDARSYCSRSYCCLLLQPAKIVSHCRTLNRNLFPTLHQIIKGDEEFKSPCPLVPTT
jgi:hypothetical protein